MKTDIQHVIKPSNRSLMFLLYFLPSIIFVFVIYFYVTSLSIDSKSQKVVQNTDSENINTLGKYVGY